MYCCKYTNFEVHELNRMYTVMVSSDSSTKPVDVSQASKPNNLNSTISPANLVIGTNDFSIVAKRSSERLQYFKQTQHLRHFVSKPRRRAPLINLGYAIRTIFIDLIIKRFLDTHFQLHPSSPNHEESSIVLVNLGCGYDPGFFKLVTLNSNEANPCQSVRYVDADYPDLIRKKHAMINQSAELSLLIPNFAQTPIGSFATAENQAMSYALLGCDLCQTASFIESLKALLGGSHDRVLFISEVSTVYMPANKSDELLSALGRTFPDAVYACLEQVSYPSPTAFSDTMFSHFGKLKTPLRGTIKYPTMNDQVSRLMRFWSTVELSTLLEIWNRMDHRPKTASEKTRLLQVEEFDEWYVRHPT